jgi:hypothetical protein
MKGRKDGGAKKGKGSQSIHTYIGQGGMCKHRKSFKDIFMIIIFYNSWPVSLKVNRNIKHDLNKSQHLHVQKSIRIQRIQHQKQVTL